MDQHTKVVITTDNQIQELSAKVDKLNVQLEDLKKNFQPQQPPIYLTRNQLKKLLNVDLSTLHNWGKRGILNPYGIGGRVYYLFSEIQSQMLHLKQKK